MSATVQKMEPLKLGLLMEAVINFEITLRLTAFFLSVRRGDNFLTTIFVVLNVEAFTLILTLKGLCSRNAGINPSLKNSHHTNVKILEQNESCAEKKSSLLKLDQGAHG